jgi:hypothetical protein
MKMLLQGEPTGNVAAIKIASEPRSGGPAREASGGHGARGGVPFK